MFPSTFHCFFCRLLMCNCWEFSIDFFFSCLISQQNVETFVSKWHSFSVSGTLMTIKECISPSAVLVLRGIPVLFSERRTEMQLVKPKIARPFKLKAHWPYKGDKMWLPCSDLVSRWKTFGWKTPDFLLNSNFVFLSNVVFILFKSSAVPSVIDLQEIKTED